MIVLQQEMGESSDTFVLLFSITDLLFSISFTMELIVRLQAYGWVWMLDWGNFADAMLVLVTCVITTILGFMGEGTKYYRYKVL
jgi:hypothetical protein